MIETIEVLHIFAGLLLSLCVALVLAIVAVMLSYMLFSLIKGLANRNGLSKKDKQPVSERILTNSTDSSVALFSREHQN